METPVTTGPSPVVPPSPSAFPIFTANPSAQVGIATAAPGAGTLHVVATPTTTAHGAPPNAAVGTLQVTTPVSMSQQQTQQPPVPASPGGVVHQHPQHSPTNFYGTLQSPTQPVTMQQVTLTPSGPGAGGGAGPVVQSVAMAQVGLQSPSVMVQVRLRITVEPLNYGRYFKRSRHLNFTTE